MRIDTHMHLHRTAEEGRAVVAAYPITEYGEKADVALSARAGTVQDALEALAEAGADHGCALSSYELPGVPRPPGGARHWPASPPHPEHLDALRERDAWLCSACAPHPELLPFVTVNPGVLDAAGAAAHVAEMADDHGARGLKLHPIALRMHPDDPAMTPTFEVCADRGLPVVVHCGPDRHGAGWSEPAAFDAVLTRHPRLRLVLAHLGGASWRDTAALAAAHPQAWFDLAEIVAWTGGSNAPTAEDLVGLIRTVGPDRVLMGSDFPWYDPADTVAEVSALPGLGGDERAAILGGNAARLLGLA